jgi:hypothetical protein
MVKFFLGIIFLPEAVERIIDLSPMILFFVQLDIVLRGIPGLVGVEQVNI